MVNSNAAWVEEVAAVVAAVAAVVATAAERVIRDPTPAPVDISRSLRAAIPRVKAAKARAVRVSPHR